MSAPPVEPPTELSPRESAEAVRRALPHEGLFAGHEWRVSPDPFPLSPVIVSELESLGRVLLQFYRAVNLLYRKSLEGKQPDWVARWSPRVLAQPTLSRAWRTRSAPKARCC